MNDVNFQEILAALQPHPDPIILLLDIVIYIVFFMNLIAFFMQDDKQINATLLMGLAILGNLVAKLSTYYAGDFRPRLPIDALDPNNLTMLIVNSMIFIIPLIVTGMSKAKKSKPLTIISGVLSGVFFFGYWFVLQSGNMY
jgi:hypothetical protein